MFTAERKQQFNSSELLYIPFEPELNIFPWIFFVFVFGFKQILSHSADCAIRDCRERE